MYVTLRLTMKLKATISLPGEDFSVDQRFALASLVIATNTPTLHNEVYDRVLSGHLRVPARMDKDAFGPAEYFTQLSDRMTPAVNAGAVGFEVTLSRVSVTNRRAPGDFWDGLAELHRIYCDLATQHLALGMRAQVYTSMALDRPINYLDKVGQTSLPEHGPDWVDGSALVIAPNAYEVIRAEMRALLGDRKTLGGLVRLLEESGRSLSAEQSIRPNPESGI